jgi:hypothetical protein
MWNVKANVIPVIIGQLQILHTVPKQHAGKSRNRGTTKNSHIGLCTCTSQSTTVKVQIIQHGK